MEIERKLKALDRIYAVYNEFIHTQPTACRRHCHRCCTNHVTLTSLEAYQTCQTLPPGERERLFRRVDEASGHQRFRPVITINALAEMCAVNQEPPPEEAAFSNEKCPLLLQDLCSIYALRPFNCRCFVSRTPCEAQGYADVDETVLAVNTIFLQTIEHVDADGCSANLLDMIAVMESEKNRAAYAAGRLHCTGNGLIANRPMKALMTPPEQRETLGPIIRKLREIRV